MKTSPTMTYPAALPVLHVRVKATTPVSRAPFVRTILGLIALVSVAACVGTFAWSACAEIRTLAAQSQSLTPAPACTADQWMACFARH